MAPKKAPHLSRSGWKGWPLGCVRCLPLAVRLLVSGLLLLLWIPSLAWGILGVEDLRPGMKGVGKTVFSGTRVESFSVEIVDILYASGFSTDLILVRVEGEKIDQIGGICAGMSGSPVIIDGHLVGAIAFTTPMSDTHYGFVTPIKDMLKLLEIGRPRVTPAEPALTEDRGRYWRWMRPASIQGLPILEGPPAWSNLGRGLAGAQRWPSATRGLLPVGTPVMMAGLSRRAGDRLAGQLRRCGLRPIQAGTLAAGSRVPPDKLQLGSAIGLSMASGDVALTALGTLTYLQGQDFLAFGHPFLQRGESALYLVPAYIHQVVRSLDLPFKIGSPLSEPVGLVTQDRGAGVSGRLGAVRDGVSLRLKIKDEDWQRERGFAVQIARDPELTPSLVAVCVLTALDEVLDRVGEGTAQVRWGLQGEGLPEELRCENLIYSSADVASEVVEDLSTMVEALEGNEFQMVRLRQIQAEVVVRRLRQTGRVQGIRIEPQQVRPGEVVRIEVILAAYRGAPQAETFELTVPQDLPPQEAMVVARGRDREQDLWPSDEASVIGGWAPWPRSFEALLTRLAQDRRRTILTVELQGGAEAADAWQWDEAAQRLSPEEAFGEQQPDLEGARRPLRRRWRPVYASVTREVPFVVQGTAEQRLTLVNREERR